MVHWWWWSQLMRVKHWYLSLCQCKNQLQFIVFNVSITSLCLLVERAKLTWLRRMKKLFFLRSSFINTTQCLYFSLFSRLSFSKSQGQDTRSSTGEKRNGWGIYWAVMINESFVSTSLTLPRKREACMKKRWDKIAFISKTFLLSANISIKSTLRYKETFINFIIVMIKKRGDGKPPAKSCVCETDIGIPVNPFATLLQDCIMHFTRVSG